MQSGSYDYVPIERVRWGTPAVRAVADETDRLGATRVFTTASRSLSRGTTLVSEIRAALGARDVGIFEECREHVPLESVIACAAAVRAAAPDLIVTIGGGTPIDTIKIVQLCLAHEVHDARALAELAGKPTTRPSLVRQLIVPTTLSGGEYSSFAGGLDTTRKVKDMYYGPDLCGRVIVLDPHAALATPEWLWLSTAVRALDHAIEGYCAPTTNALVRANALHAMRLFAVSLRRTKQDPSDLEARHSSQMATWLAASGLGRVSMGASHGIGYFLGSLYGVPHGYTSCVMLPAVLAWNEQVTGELQKEIAAAMDMPQASASQAVATLLDDLGMPRTLRDIKIAAEQLPTLAKYAAEHPVVRANPRPIRNAEEVLEILALAQ